MQQEGVRSLAFGALSLLAAEASSTPCPLPAACQSKNTSCFGPLGANQTSLPLHGCRVPIALSRSFSNRGLTGRSPPRILVDTCAAGTSGTGNRPYRLTVQARICSRTNGVLLATTPGQRRARETCGNLRARSGLDCGRSRAHRQGKRPQAWQSPGSGGGPAAADPSCARASPQGKPGGAWARQGWEQDSLCAVAEATWGPPGDPGTDRRHWVAFLWSRD